MSDISNRLTRLLSPNVLAMNAYRVADSSGMLKLDAMENPYTWDEAMTEDWLATLKSAQINRYPDPSAQGIKHRLLEKYSIRDGVDVMFGNGSDELIQLLIMAVMSSNKAVIAPSPSFVMYKVIADYLDVPFIDVPLHDDFSLDVESMVTCIHKEQPALIFLATPNNPTGTIYSDSDLTRIIEASDGLVVLDEAYTAFTDSDQLHWLSRYPHVLVMRTFSKVGLAGLRLGFMLGDEQCLHELDKLRLPYNINTLTQLSVEFALDNFSVLDEQAAQLVAQRAFLFEQLNQFDAFSCFESDANF
ncbi:MAG: aminotransferase class I/II-fold pyridoxal phosphate-dependent enzyme, partial [Pseudomonadota bacterium]